MLLKLLTTMAGPDGSHLAGAVAEFDQETAKALIEGGYAEHIGSAAAAVPAPAPNVGGNDLAAQVATLTEELSAVKAQRDDLAAKLAAAAAAGDETETETPPVEEAVVQDPAPPAKRKPANAAKKD